MSDNKILLIQVAISILGCFVYSIIIKKIRKKEIHASYEKTIQSIWAKKGTIASIVNATLFCIPLVFFVLYNSNLISMSFLCGFCIAFLVAALIMLFGFLVPLIRKWSIGTIRMGEEYIEIFDAKYNKRTNFKWTEIEWITVVEAEESAVQIFVDNRVIEVKGISAPYDVITMFQQKCPTKCPE